MMNNCAKYFGKRLLWIIQLLKQDVDLLVKKQLWTIKSEKKVTSVIDWI